MKVLHISAGALYGGVERVLATLAACRALCPAMQPHFALCFEGRLSGELRALGAPVHSLGGVRVSRPSSVLRARAALRRLLAEERFDAAVCHLPWALAIFGPAVEAAGAPLVFWMHGFATGRHWTERWARRTPPALVICNSRATAATSRLLFPEVRAEVFYNPVCLGGGAAREPHAAPTILQVSRMEPWKGHSLHLDALALLPADLDWRCRFVGGAQRPSEQRYLDGLRGKAETLGIAGRVQFAGETPRAAAEFASADLFCQPNTGPEPFGLVFVEALAAGLPVVATRLGAAPEIVDDTCGVLVEPAQPAALAEALARLLHGQALRARLGAAGPDRARQLCDPERQLPLLHRLLDLR